MFLCFFFQAEDGIRDGTVTGVQTCALPIFPGDVRRLAARARTRDTVLVPFLTGEAAWPGADLRLRVQDGQWSGIGEGYGRLRQRRVTVNVEGRGQAARPRSAQLWLPNAGGGI